MQSNGLSCGMVKSICHYTLFLFTHKLPFPTPILLVPSPATTLLWCWVYSITVSFSLTPIPFFLQAYGLKKVLCVIKNKLGEERSMRIQHVPFTACKTVHEQCYKQMHVYFDDLVTWGTEPRAHILTQSGSRICFMILVPQYRGEWLGFCHTYTGSMRLYVWTSAREAGSA